MAEETLARYPNLAVRNGTFYLRLRVPKDLVGDLGKTHIVRSLKTKDRPVALGRYRTEQGRAEREFASARKQRAQLTATKGLLASGRLEKLSPAEIEGIAIRWFEQAVQQVAQRRGASLTQPEVDWDAVLEDAKATDSILTSPNTEDYAPYVENVTGQILVSAGADVERTLGSQIKRANPIPRVDRGTKQYAQLTNFVRRGLIALNQLKLSALTGTPIESRDPLFTAAGASPQEKPRHTLDDLITSYKGDPGRTGRPDMISFDYGFIFSALTEILGSDTDITNISRQDIKRLRDILISLPPNSTKRFPGKKLSVISELATQNNLQKIRTKTVNEHINKIAAIFNWAIREEWITKNPASKLMIERSDDSQIREPFQPSQLKAIFSAPIYTGCKDDERGYATVGPLVPRRARFWLPLISLFHGMRLNECAQLATNDINERDGTPVFLVRAAGEDQRIKSKAASRTVPIHPTLIRIGFLDFVILSRQSERLRLFPELQKDARGYYSDAFQKWFSRYLVSCGAARVGTSFHSFRHGWADRLREAGIPEDRRRVLGGWADTGVDAGYGHGFTTQQLAKDIAAVDYPGLDLSHLW